MQKIVLPIVGLVTFGLTLAILFLFGPGGVSGAAQPFLDALAKRDFVAAANTRSARFRDAVSQDAFERFLAESKIGMYTSGSWSGWKIENGVGTVDGEFRTATGETRPLRLSLLEEEGVWRIDSIQPLRADADRDTPEAVLPTPIEAVTLIRDATGLFARGVVAGDFTELRDASAPELKAQFSVADLDTQFKAFVDNRINLLPLEEVAPNLSAEPAVDSDAIVRLVGYYPVAGGRVEFDYKFVYRYIGWRLISINVNVVPDA
jgi:hypothetical protein